MNEHDLLLLFSGGLESRYLLHLASQMLYKPYCLLIDYGQKHGKELEYAISVCNNLRIPFEVVNVLWNTNSALTGDKETKYDNVSPWYVPARNLIFVSVAAGVAESKGIDTIWIGANYDDRINQFPDCSQEWVVSINETLQKSLSRPVRVIAPLLGFTKEMVWALAEQAGIKKEEVFSGYGKYSGK